MHKIITVDMAITAADRMIKYPVLAVMFVPVIVSIGLQLTGHLPAWGILLVLAISIISAWAIYCFSATRWRLWAFNKVRNVHELKAMAGLEQYWPFLCLETY